MNADSQIDLITEKPISYDGGIPPMGKSVQWSANLRSRTAEQEAKENSSGDSSLVDSKGLPEEQESNSTSKQEVPATEEKENNMDINEEDTSWF